MRELSAREIELQVGESLPGWEGLLWKMLRLVDEAAFGGMARNAIYRAVDHLLFYVAVEICARTSSEASEAQKALEERVRNLEAMARRHESEIFARRFARTI